MKDRRLHPRAPLETAVECQLAQAKGSLNALSRHIGADGLGIITSAKLSVGAALSSVRFTLPAEDNVPEARLELAAQVVRCTEVSEQTAQFIAGLQFLEATRADLERIEEYVFRRLSPEAQAASRAKTRAAEKAISVDAPEDLEELVDLVDIETADLDMMEREAGTLETAETEAESDAPTGDTDVPAPSPADAGDAPPSGEAVEESEEAPARRIPFSQPISVRFDLFKDFVKEVSANISTTGMFIQTAKPRKIGSILEFSFDMGDDFTLLQGSGEVVWARHRREGPELPAGMGIRFIDMDPSSRNVIKRIVNDYTALGHQPFDLEASAPTDLPLAEAGVEEALETAAEAEFVELEEVNPELRERLRTLLRAKRERDELLQRLKKSEREKYALEKELAGIGAGAQKAQLGWKSRLAQLEETVLDAESVESDLKSNIAELASSLAAALEERDRLTEQRQELLDKQEELSAQLQADQTADTEIDGRAEETEKLRGETAERQKELEDEVAAARTKADESRSKADALEAEVEQLRSQLEDGKGKLEAVETQLEEERAKTAELEAQEQKIADLEGALAEGRNELDVARQEIDRLDQERLRLESKVAEDATLIAAARDSADMLNSARDDFEAQLTLAAETEQELTGRISELEAEAESERREAELNLEQSGAQRAELKSKLERALEDLDRLLDSSERAKRDFEAELAENASAVHQAEEKNSELLTSVESLERDLETARNEIESVRQTADDDLEHKRRKVEEIQTRLSEVEDELAQVVQSKTDVESERRKIEEELQAGLGQATEKTEQQLALVSELDAKLEAKAEAEEQMSRRLGELESLLEEKISDSAEIEKELEMTLASLDETREKSAGELAELRRESEEKQSELAKLNEQLDELRSESGEKDRELATLNGQLDQLRSESDEKDRELATLNGQLDQLRNESEEKDRELATLNGQLDELRNESEEKDRELATLNGQLDQLRNESEEKTESASKEQEDLRRRIEELESELAETTSSFSETEDRLRSRLERFQEELDEERAAAETRHREIAAAAQLDGGTSPAPTPLPYPTSPATQRRRSRFGSAISGLAAGLFLGAIAVFALYQFSDFDLPRPGGDRGPVEFATAERGVEEGPSAATTSDAAAEPGTATEVEDPSLTADLPGAAESSSQDSTEPAATGIDQPAETSTSTADVVATQPDPRTADAAVRAWAASWSDQRVDDYLSHYAVDFVPADGSTRAEWVEQRRVRVARPKTLEVTVRGLERDVLAPGRVQLTFNQAYQSDTFGDEVDKTLEMVWEQDQWKIIREFAEPS